MMLKKINVLLIVLAVIIAAGVFFYLRRGSVPVEPRPVTADRPAEGRKSITLYFADANLTAVFPEQREIAVSDTAGEINSGLRQLAVGTQAQDRVSLFPQGFEFDTIYIDKSTLYLNIRSEHFASVNWGSSAEILALRSLCKTIGTNWPEIKYLSILVDGENAKTFGAFKGSGGHIEVYSPLSIH